MNDKRINQDLQMNIKKDFLEQQKNVMKRILQNINEKEQIILTQAFREVENEIINNDLND